MSLKATTLVAINFLSAHTKNALPVGHSTSGNTSTNSFLEAFFAAGYGQQQVLEVILGLSQKVISNYVNHVAHTPVDKVFDKFAWSKK